MHNLMLPRSEYHFEQPQWANNDRSLVDGLLDVSGFVYGSSMHILQSVQKQGNIANEGKLTTLVCAF